MPRRPHAYASPVHADSGLEATRDASGPPTPRGSSYRPERKLERSWGERVAKQPGRASCFIESGRPDSSASEHERRCRWPPSLRRPNAHARLAIRRCSAWPSELPLRIADRQGWLGRVAPDEAREPRWRCSTVRTLGALGRGSESPELDARARWGSPHATGAFSDQRSNTFWTSWSRLGKLLLVLSERRSAMMGAVEGRAPA